MKDAWPLVGVGVVAWLWWARDAKARPPMHAPLDVLKPSSLYGLRRSPTQPGAPMTCHRGVDLPAPTGTPVYAALPGVVVVSRETPTGGQSVILQHPDDMQTVYLHLSRRDVDEGDTVAAGDVVGAVGSTGRSTGPHLHFGLKVDGQFVDPGPLLGLPAGVSCE